MNRNGFVLEDVKSIINAMVCDLREMKDIVYAIDVDEMIAFLDNLGDYIYNHEERID